MRHHQVIRYALGAIPLALLASYLYARAALLFSGPSERGDAVILAPEGGQSGEYLRLAGALINCADPSRGTFLDDGRLFEAWPGPDTLRISPSMSVTLQGAYLGNEGALTDWFPRKGDELTEALSVPLRGWVTPDWKQRRKDSWQILTDFFGTY